MGHSIPRRQKSSINRILFKPKYFLHNQFQDISEQRKILTGTETRVGAEKDLGDLPALAWST